MQKKILLLLLSLMILTVAVYADAVIIEFSAEPAKNKIILTWKTGEEKNLERFIIERSTNKKDFRNIGELTPKGSNSNYEYIDDNLAGVKSIYYYRLRILNDDGTHQLSESISVIPNISSFAKTWGSIKALFQ